MSEGWRTLNEQLLGSPGIKYYKSIAWLTTADYWQDAPGRQFMNVNLDVAHRGVRIERIVILRDHLWHADELLPSTKILPWISEPHNHGLWIMVVRESELTREADWPDHTNRAFVTSWPRHCGRSLVTPEPA